jgi:spermidine synthase
MPLLLLFLSGAAALIYQTLWVKQLGLIVGVDVYAVTITLSAFFSGLALGAGFFGARADRIARPLMLVAALEVGIAVLACCTTIALSYLPAVIRASTSFSEPVVFLILFALIGLPACLMGGTLPALVRAVGPDKGTVGRASGRLYAANTLGAIVGTLSVPLGLIPLLGVRGTGMAAAGLNLGVAVLAGLAARSSQKSSTAPESPPDVQNPGFRLALLLYALAGGLALGYEVVWSQAILPFLSSRSSAFAIMLATYLMGLMLGSFLFAHLSDRTRHPWRVFGLLISGAGVSAFLIFLLLGPWLWDAQDFIGRTTFKWFSSNLLANMARFGMTTATVLLLPTILLGAAFPAAARLVAGPERIGRDVGLVSGLNMVGGILGTLLTGFVLIPNLGLSRSLGLLAVFSVIVGGIALAQEKATRKLGAAMSLFVILVIGFATFQVSGDQFSEILAYKRQGKVVFYQESPAGAVAVLEQTTSSGNQFRRLYIQGVSNSGDAMTSLRYMRLQALLPLIIHAGEPKSTLVIGMGTGITAGALLAYPTLEERVVAELLPGVVKAAPLFSGNFNVATDSSVDVRLRDGRHELLASHQKYDLITLEPPPPSAAGVVNLYSQDFYELARDRLKPQGLLAQWWPLRTQNDEESQSLVASFIEVFPYVTLWSTEMHEGLLVGSMEPIVLDVERIEERYRQPSVSAALAEAGVLSPGELVATYVTDRDGLVKYVGDAKPVTDDRPRIEYAGWVRKDEFPRVLMRIAELRTEPKLSNSTPELEREFNLEHEKLWSLYQAGYNAYIGDAEGWRASMKLLQDETKSNPYFRWFLGQGDG